ADSRDGLLPDAAHADRAQAGRMTSAEEHLKVIRDELAEERKAEARENARGNDPVIRLEHVNLTFDRPILEDVSLEARKGETLMVAGESGSGKPTSLKLILRLLVPDSGRIIVLGHDVGSLTFQEALDLRREIGMVFQNAALFDSLTVYENVAYPLR